MTLSDLAFQAGLSSADVACLAGVEESTISRLWSIPDWLDRVKGKTLQALIAVVPGIAEELVGGTLRQRRNLLSAQLAEEGLHVDSESFRFLVVEERIPEQLLANALSAALYIMRGESQKTATYLARFWGRPQDEALSFLWNHSAKGGLLQDASPLIEKSAELMTRFAENTQSYHAMLGHATLSHHVAKATGRIMYEPDGSNVSRRNAMSYRSTMIARILQSQDISDVQRYQRTVHDNPLLSMVESWSFPTYNRDATATTDFSLPGAVSLRNTALELQEDIWTDNEAYLLYLVSIAVPRMLRCDPTLGSRVTQVHTMACERAESVESSIVRQAMGTMIKSLPIAQ